MTRRSLFGALFGGGAVAAAGTVAARERGEPWPCGPGDHPVVERYGARIWLPPGARLVESSDSGQRLVAAVPAGDVVFEAPARATRFAHLAKPRIQLPRRL